MNINWQINAEDLDSESIELNNIYTFKDSTKCPIYALGTPIPLLRSGTQIGECLLNKENGKVIVKIISLLN